ncbi:hypothetical protein Taro_037707 [Colocasia esculenta]|uniref:Protein kinase domain-containing protein n=1 Tax=Colocasia esculenta TaxID=4460 RepID=A0A843WLI5_COLES|nr:hypothetical protein [Colocasia esculenta]
MYVDALSSPMIDERSQFAGDGLDGLAADGSRIHGAGDQFFSHGGTNAGVPGLFKLNHYDMEGPWSPVCCFPGQHTPHGPTAFPPSPSSGGYHPEFAETDGRIPDEYVKQSLPPQSMWYDHHHGFVDDVVYLPPLCVAVHLQAASEGEDVDLKAERETDSKIELTLADAEALAKGLQTVKTDDLEVIRELGSGTYGSVHHGKWRGSNVAIKRIKAACFAERSSIRGKAQ